MGNRTHQHLGETMPLFARCAFTLGVAVTAFALLSGGARAQNAARIARGRYIVEGPGGCGDCHTPGALTGKPDMARPLGGSDIGWAVPGLGVFVGPNLTPDKKTGLGTWTAEQIVTAFTRGRRPDGRILAPAMPWRDFAHLTRSDAFAVAVYLKSLRPVRHAVPGPFGPGQKVTLPVMTMLPAGVYNRLAKSRSPSGEARRNP